MLTSGKNIAQAPLQRSRAAGPARNGSTDLDGTEPPYLIIADFFGWFDAAGNNREDGRAVLARYAVNASVWTIADTARGDRSRLITDCSFDYVEKFVTGVPMHRQSRAGLKPRKLHAPLGRRIGPQPLR